jgi:DNA-directed RNA polymerase
MLGKMVYDGTREVVKGGAVMMNWLQSIAKIASKHNVHLSWTLPHGFIAKQSYVKYKKKKVFTRLDGDTTIQSTLYDPTDKIDAQRSQNSISPNFVHSLDACALMTTVLKAKARGITTFHMVHDDYGTHAADTQLLSDLLREAFVELYRDNDILNNFRDEVLKQLPKGTVLPPAPKPGSFDIEEVLESDFFFA